MRLRQHGISAILLNARQKGGRCIRLHALYTVLAFCVVLAVSGPHRVHHLPELAPPGHQHSHDESTQQLPDCPVLFLLQHTPLTEGAVVCLPGLLQTHEQLVIRPSLWKPKESRDASQARAPPRTSLHSLRYN